MATFSYSYQDLVAAIERELGGAISSSSLIPQWITFAEAWCHRRFDLDCFRGISTGTLMGGDNSITLPEDYFEFRKLILIKDGRRYFVDLASEDRITDFREDDVGIPAVCYPEGGSLILLPKADNTYSYKLKYKKKLQPLSMINPNNDFLDNYFDLIYFRTLLFSAPYLREDGRLTTWRSILKELEQDIEDNQWRRDNPSKFRRVQTRHLAF